MLFVGHPRSSHSLVGALLDAHPNAVISHELDVLHLIHGRELTRSMLYELILERSRWFAASGWEWQGYSYAVPSGWQGRHREIYVIGDKKGGGTSRLLLMKPDLLSSLADLVDVPVRVLHVVRNPFDNLATSSVKDHDGDVRQALLLFRQRWDLARRIRRERPEDVFDLHVDRLSADPGAAVVRLCEFVGLDPSVDGYLDACRSVVFETPRRTSLDIDWPPDVTREVEEAISTYDFLTGYRMPA